MSNEIIKTSEEFKPYPGYFSRGGDGSKEKPFLSPYASDIYDIIRHLRDLMLITGQPAWFDLNRELFKIGLNKECVLEILELENPSIFGSDLVRNAVATLNKNALSIREKKEVMPSKTPEAARNAAPKKSFIQQILDRL